MATRIKVLFSKDYLLFSLFFLLAMTFSVAHLPQEWPLWLAWLRPNFVFLIIFFWGTEYSNRISLLFIWLLGLMLDVLHLNVLGIHALWVVIVSYIGWSLFGRFSFYSFLQQSGIVFIICFFQSLFYGMLIFDDWTSVGFEAFFSALITALLWPYVSMVIRRLY